MPHKVRVLIIEDSPVDAELMVAELQRGGIRATWKRVRSADQLRAALAEDAWDIVLSDYSLPGFGANAGLEIVRETVGEIPFIVVSGSVGEEVAVEMMRAGANDYVLKDSMVRLAAAVTRELRESGKRRAAEQLNQNILNSLSSHIAVLDREGTIVAVNSAWKGFAARHATLENANPGVNYLEIGRQPTGPYASFASRFSEGIQQVLDGDLQQFAFEYQCHATSPGRWYLLQTTPLGTGRTGVVVSHTDITDRKIAEAALHESDERYRILLDRLPAPLFVYDRETRQYLAVNDTAIRTYGYSREEFLQMQACQLYSPEDATAFRELLAQRGSTFEDKRQWKHRKKDGTLIDVEVTAHSLDLSGHPACIMLAIDITDRLRADREVRQTSNLLRAVSDSSPDAIFVKDLQGRYLLFNPAASRFVGVPAEQVIGRDDRQLFDSAGAELVMERDRQVISRGVVQTAEEQLTAAGVSRIYLATKAPYRDAEGQVVGVIGISREITAQKRAEAELQLRDRAIQAATQGILITDPNQPDNPIIYASPGFERLTGYRYSEVLGRNCRFLQGPDSDAGAVAQLHEAVQAKQRCTVEILNYRKDGTPFWNELSISPVHDSDDQLSHFVGVLADVTARRRLEEQLRQSQKMEAFGQLAGGVAHDFNNLLTVIIGYSDILRESLNREDHAFGLVGEILHAGERAATLTRQLLAFSRRQVLQPTVLDLNAVTREMEKMLRRLISEEIRLMTQLDPHLWLTRADPGQIEQVIVNLVVNARDAMPHGGRLTIATQNASLDPGYVLANTEMRNGECVMLSVTDTGHGIPEEIRSRIFEPFFTTKEVGKGTGLGLATVHGILKQSGGHIDVESVVGKGTTFKVYLPRVEEPTNSEDSQTSQYLLPRGSETILLVEDETGVRTLISRVLKGCGYTVLDASSGEEAMRLVALHSGNIHLLISDVVMPGMGGWQVAEWLKSRYSKAQVLFVSGYANDSLVHHGVQHEGANLLQKPFSSFDLASRVREILDTLQQ